MHVSGTGTVPVAGYCSTLPVCAPPLHTVPSIYIGVTCVVPVHPTTSLQASSLSLALLLICPSSRTYVPSILNQLANFDPRQLRATRQ